MTRPERYRDDPALFWCRVDQSGGPDACWNWLGSMKPQGYGQITWRGRKGWLTHRVALDLVGVTVPVGWHTDHLCTNKRCCNPRHLEPVPPSVNGLRAGAQKAWPLFCAHGHYMNGENILLRENGRPRCKQCRRRVVRESQRRRRQQRQMREAA